MTGFELWMQGEWVQAPELAKRLARELDAGTGFEDLWRRRDEWGGTAPEQLWKWRRLYDEHRQLQAQMQACAAAFWPFLTDASAVRLAQAAAPFAGVSEPQRFLDAARVLLSLSLADSRVRFTVVGARVHPAFEELPALHAPPPAQLPSHRVLCALRGQKAGVVRLEVEIPAGEITRQWELRRDPSWPSESLAFWLRVLPGLVWEETVARAQREAVAVAAEVYRGLLSAPGIDASRGAIAVYVGAPRQSAGAVCVDARGRWVEQTGFSADAKGFSQLCAWCAAHPDVPVVLPATAPDAGRLRDLLRELAGRAVTRVRPAALSWSRQMMEKLPSHVASARVLLERALDPLGSFQKIPANRLGLAEYQPEIPDSLLQPAFSDMAAWVRLKREEAACPAGLLSPDRPALSGLVRTVADLRPGMQVSGIITSIVPFGVFVNLGLEADGFIHVSELDEDFVKDPAEKVQLGQRVMCRVLQVEPDRKRISLSLRLASGPVPPKRGRPSAQRQKLDALFRK